MKREKGLLWGEGLNPIYPLFTEFKKFYIDKKYIELTNSTIKRLVCRGWENSDFSSYLGSSISKYCLTTCHVMFVKCDLCRYGLQEHWSIPFTFQYLEGKMFRVCAFDFEQLINFTTFILSTIKISSTCSSYLIRFVSVIHLVRAPLEWGMRWAPTWGGDSRRSVLPLKLWWSSNWTC